MRIIIAALAALMATAFAAWAGDAEGKIRKVDAEKMTITLDDGKTYKLPPEINLEGIEAGVTILIAFEVMGGVNQITDMELSE